MLLLNVYLCENFKGTNGSMIARWGIFAWPGQARREWGAGGEDAGQGAWVKCVLMQMRVTLVTRWANALMISLLLLNRITRHVCKALCVLYVCVCVCVCMYTPLRCVCVWLYVCDCMTVNHLTGGISLPVGWDDRGRLVNIIRGPGLSA